MAGYKEHISVSGLLGVCYALAATFFGFTGVQGALAGLLTWIAGMLPDLDSQTGRPVREVFSLVAAIVPLTMMERLREWGHGNPETTLLYAIGIYMFIRYVCSNILGKISVHRGMFHSIPALLIAAELAFLTYKSPVFSVRLLMAGGVGFGFMSHLILDELYSVQRSGVRIRLNKSAGSAFKFVGKQFLPNVVTYSMLMLLSYATLVDVGLAKVPEMPGQQSPTYRQAVEDIPTRH